MKSGHIGTPNPNEYMGCVCGRNPKISKSIKRVSSCCILYIYSWRCKKFSLSLKFTFLDDVNVKMHIIEKIVKMKCFRDWLLKTNKEHISGSPPNKPNSKGVWRLSDHKVYSCICFNATDRCSSTKKQLTWCRFVIALNNIRQ